MSEQRTSPQSQICSLLWRQWKRKLSSMGEHITISGAYRLRLHVFSWDSDVGTTISTLRPVLRWTAEPVSEISTSASCDERPASLRVHRSHQSRAMQPTAPLPISSNGGVKPSTCQCQKARRWTPTSILLQQVTTSFAIITCFKSNKTYPHSLVYF